MNIEVQELTNRTLCIVLFHVVLYLYSITDYF